VAVDGADNLYIADLGNNRVREVGAATGVITTVAGAGLRGEGGDGGPATQALLNSPYNVAVDGAGNLYIADFSNSRVREVAAATGIITTVAGTGTGGYGGDGGPATQALLNLPYGVAVDGSGNLYIADLSNNRVREVVAATGVITTVAGNGAQGYGGDGGPAIQASLYSPAGVAVDGADNLYIADSNNNRVREVGAATGVITTVAGNGAQGYGGDGGPATQAEMNHPDGVAVDGAGNLYITDAANNRVREVGGIASGGSSQQGQSSHGGGVISWHAHHNVRLAANLEANVDLTDGHVDVNVSTMQLPGRGPALAMDQAWDSVRAQAGLTTTAGQGWVSSLSPSIGGSITGTLVFTDDTGASWPLTYTGALTATAPYTSYSVPPGQPWQLTIATAPTTTYTLTNILTGATMSFDSQGRYSATADAYGNQNALPITGGPGPSSISNSGGRSIQISYGSTGLLTELKSPLWVSGGGGQAGSQHVVYGYKPGTSQLQTITAAASTTAPLTTTFGYSGTQLISVTTPYTQAAHTWPIGYDAQGRVAAITSPSSGVQGQAGYTPAYTTAFSYTTGQTTVVEGFGTSGALTTTYTLDGQGEPTAVSDGLGDTSYTTYDQDHDVLNSQDANGNQTTNAYAYVGPNGSTGLITQTVRPPLGSYLLAGSGSVSTPITTTRRYDPTTYDLLETDRVANGTMHITENGYDGRHSVITTTELLAATQTGGGTGCGNVATAMTPQGRFQHTMTVRAAAITASTCVYHTTYQWRGRINQYDQYGERVASVDGRGVNVPNTTDTTATITATTLTAAAKLYTSHTVYDTQGDVTSSGTPPISATVKGVSAMTPVTTTEGYDGDGERTSVTSANGNTTTYGYDHLGRQVGMTLPAVTLWTGATVTPTEVIGYDGDGNTVSTRDATGALTTSLFDPLERQISTTNPVSGTSIITDNATEQVASQDPQGNITRQSYDGAGRLSQETDPTGGVTQYQYDPVGNTVAITSGDGTTPTSVETRGYDAWNHTITDTVAGPGTAPQTTLTAYDEDGNTTQVVQPNGDSTQDFYDLADQHLETFVLPAGATSSSSDEQESYDAAGNVTARLDFDNRLHQTTYDGDNRAIQSTDTYTTATAMTTTATFDPDGNALSQATITQTTGISGQVRTSGYTTTVAYNAADWPITATEQASGSQPVATRYGYDAVGQQRTQTVLNGRTPVTTALDAEGRATAIGKGVGGSTAYTTTVGYNQDDQPITTTLPNGVREVGRYDGAGRLTALTATAPVSNAYGYGYSAATGWTTGVTATLNGVTTTQTQTLAHDAEGRLTGMQGSDGTRQSWAYDGDGNLLTSASNGVTTTYGYSASVPNELQTLAVPGQATRHYGYDQSGDTTRITSTAGISTGLQYDSRARLAGVTLAGGTRVSQTYNAAGQRAHYTVTKSGQPTLTETFSYRGDALGQAVVVSGTKAYTDTYLYGVNNAPLELLRQQGGTTSRYWYVVDGRGNVVALTSITGTVVDRYAYDLWGAPTATSESVPQPFRYAGYWYDAAPGWYWVRVRPYDPALKRWLQPDPSEQDGVRTYVYADDNPVDETDPTGLDVGGVAVGAGAACVGTIWIPFFGEITCADAILLVGAAFVADYIVHHYPHAHTPPADSGAAQGHQSAPLHAATWSPTGTITVRIAGRIYILGAYREIRKLDRNIRRGSQIHHIIQDAACESPDGRCRISPDYSYYDAPAILLEGGSTVPGSPHDRASRAQYVGGNGTYEGEREVGYRALIAAGTPPLLRVG